MKLNKKYVVLISSIVILAGMVFIPVASAHGTDTPDAPTEPTPNEYTQEEYPQPHQTYRSGCHGGGYADGQYDSRYDTHQRGGWFGGHGGMSWFGW